MHLLVVGCGYIGSALVARAQAIWGAELRISALRRTASQVPPGAHPVPLDLGSKQGWPRLQLPPVDVVVFCAAPSEPGAESYEAIYVRGTRRVLAALAQAGHPTPRVIFVSSTGVYGQDDGSSVDEQSPTQPARYQGQLMLAGEAAAREGGGSACILRCGGIYGPERNSLVRRVRAGTASPPAVQHFTNRIHRDDCVGAIVHLMQRDTCAPVYNGVDDLAAEQTEVLRFLSTRLGVPPPPLAPAGSATGKRVSNALLRADGYRFTFPTYQQGYEALLKAGSLR